MNVKILSYAFLFVAVNTQAVAQATLSGKVFDAESKSPLIGATVLVKGTTNGTTTNFDGEFTLDYHNELPVISVFSYMGYEAKELEVTPKQKVEVYLLPTASSLNEITVTARRRSEEVQEIPMAITVIGAKELDNSVSFNVNRLKELVPSVQLYSSNPRNTTLNIRGIGSTFGLTNDGIDPGVGFYVDGIYYSRPSATTLDFIDVQQIEVLRGPQGTLFGKNTTAGTFNITSRKPTFITTGIFEQTFGNFGFIQTKGSISGPVVKDKLAARLSFTGTNRDGTIYNIVTEKYTNTLNNQGIRAQLLFIPNAKTSITLAGDYTRQRPDGYAQVFAGVIPTQLPEFRQFKSIIADLNYELPSRNPFDRIIDHDTSWRSDQNMGGVSLNADIEIGRGTLTATSAWRTWKWSPSNDRDFTGLSVIAKSQAPSIHDQWSQEVRYSGELNHRLSGTAGVFAFYQYLEADGSHTLEAGSDQWRFVQNNQDPLWQTPGLLDGLKQETQPSFRNFSSALFAQLDWKVTKGLIVNPGIRINYDQKEVDFKQTVAGGLQTNDPDLIALQNRIFMPLAFRADVDDWNFSGQLGARYSVYEKTMVFANYSLGFKPVGLNLGGIPTENGQPLLDLAVIKPEQVSHFELGIKTEYIKDNPLNLTVFNTNIFNYQTTVRTAELGVIRGYLANAEQVRTRGAELEGTYTLLKYFRYNASVSYTDAEYVKFTDAPVAPEETGTAESTDISGGLLPGISKWAFSMGIEAFTRGKLIGQEGEYFVSSDVFYRSSFSSNPTPSRYLNIDGYSLINARLGFRVQSGVTVFVWSRNLANTNYFEQMLTAGGNAGYYAGVLGDPRSCGITLRYNFL